MCGGTAFIESGLLRHCTTVVYVSEEVLHKLILQSKRFKQLIQVTLLTANKRVKVTSMLIVLLVTLLMATPWRQIWVHVLPLDRSPESMTLHGGKLTSVTFIWWIASRCFQLTGRPLVSKTYFHEKVQIFMTYTRWKTCLWLSWATCPFNGLY